MARLHRKDGLVVAAQLQIGKTNAVDAVIEPRVGGRTSAAMTEHVPVGQRAGVGAAFALGSGGISTLTGSMTQL